MKNLMKVAKDCIPTWNMCTITNVQRSDQWYKIATGFLNLGEKNIQ